MNRTQTHPCEGFPRPWLYTWLLVLVLVVVASIPARGQASEAEATAFQQANALILDERWSEAEAAFAAFLKQFPRSDRRDDAAFWQCYAKEQQNPVSEAAFGCYETFIRRYRRSNYADDARANMVALGKRLAKAGMPAYAARIKSLQQQEDTEVALAALYALRDIDDEAALKTLLEIFDQSNEKLRRRIVYMLADYEAPEVVERLTRVAREDPSMEVRKAAVYALREHSEQATVAQTLKDVIASDSYSIEVRKAALYALSDVEVPDLVPTLAEIARTSTSEELAVAAAYALGNVEVAEAGRALEQVLKEARLTPARKAALYALGNREDALALGVLKSVALQTDDADLQRAAVYAIGNMDEVDAARALREIYEKARSRSVQKTVLYAMANTDDEETARAFLLEQALGAADPELGRAAVQALANHLDEGSTEQLIQILQTARHAQVKKMALHLLGEEADARAMEALAAVLKDERDPDLRKAAVLALGRTEDDAAVETLKKVVAEDPSTQVRKAAVQALGMIGTPAARKALMEILGGSGQ